MNRPNRLTVVAGAVGGLALVATAVGAVAMSNGTPETPGPTSPVTQSTADVDTGSAETDSGITRDRAVEIAEQALADHGPVPALDEVEREFEHGHEVWNVEFGDDHEAYVDVTTGEVVKLEVDDDDHGDWDDWDDDHGDHDDRDD